MGVTVARVLVGGFGVLMMLAAIGVAAVGGGGADLVGVLFLFVPGAVLLAAVVIERTRYRSLAAERTGDGHGPGGGEVAGIEPRFRPTDEVFLDPTTQHRMRVYVDAATGERRYVAEA